MGGFGGGRDLAIVAGERRRRITQPGRRRPGRPTASYSRRATDGPCLFHCICPCSLRPFVEFRIQFTVRVSSRSLAVLAFALRVPFDLLPLFAGARVLLLFRPAVFRPALPAFRSSCSHQVCVGFQIRFVVTISSNFLLILTFVLPVMFVEFALFAGARCLLPLPTPALFRPPLTGSLDSPKRFRGPPSAAPVWIWLVLLCSSSPHLSMCALP